MPSPGEWVDSVEGVVYGVHSTSVHGVTGSSRYCAAILLGHMKLSLDQIRSAVLACDEGVLTEQYLRQMETFAPSKSEVSGC